MQIFIKGVFICCIQQLKENQNPAFDCRLASKLFSRDKSDNHATTHVYNINGM